MKKLASGIVAMVCLLMSVFAQEAPPVVFVGSSGVILIQVRLGAVNDFEQSMRTLRAALAESTDDSRKRQAANWKMYRSSEAGPNGTALYVIFFDPVVPTADYSFWRNIKAVVPGDLGKSTLKQFERSVVSMNFLNLGALQSERIGTGPVTPPPATGVYQATDPEINVGLIRPKCAKDWPEDFAMRAFCEKQQNEAVAKLRSRPMPSADQRIIRNKCSKDWTDDFNMRNFCEEQQLKALAIVK